MVICLPVALCGLCLALITVLSADGKFGLFSLQLIAEFITYLALVGPPKELKYCCNSETKQSHHTDYCKAETYMA